ncbi:MAG: c-type cytochrome [bacterium]|nr:c-type cytochrome [bacterium]
MAERNFKPPEEKTSPVPFFILGLLFVAVTFWTVWDESFTRRPWKEYQKQFNQYELKLVRELLNKAKEKDGKAVAVIDKQIQAQSQKLAVSSELIQIKKELDRLKLVAFEKVQDFAFAKSTYDEAYFHYTEGVRQGHDVQKQLAHLQEAKKEVGRLQPIAEKAEAQRDALLAKIEERQKGLSILIRQRRRRSGEIADLERRIKSIKSRPYEIKQIVLREFERNNFNEPVLRVDRCHTCHLGIDRAGFENAPQPFRTHSERRFYLVEHNYKEIGCVACHGGQGSAITAVNKAHGLADFWENPILNKADQQTKCLGCHTNVFNLEKAPKLSRGIALVRELGCFGCHNIPGAEGLLNRGPDLSRIQEKVDPDWLLTWIKRPKDYNPRTKMPYLSLADQEVRDIATYVWTVGKPKAPVQSMAGLENPKLIAQGKELFESVGCLGCHIRDEKDIKAGPIKGVSGRPIVYWSRDFGPALGNAGKKLRADWLFRWLKDPKAYWPETTMPSLRLTDDEAKAITAYLMNLSPATGAASGALGDTAAFERGKSLVAKRGCAGCHVIPGMENVGKIGPDLASFAEKKPFELDFGNVVNTPKTWEAWVFGKLKNPKLYQTDRIKLLMPNFDLSDKEVSEIRTFLRGMIPHGPPHTVHAEFAERAKRIEAGRRMIEKYNCSGCHLVENWGGDILRHYKDTNDGPPPLDGEGDKVQPGWFFGFLKNVVILRPWLKVRMPNFQMPEKDAAALVNYLAALDNKLRSYVHFDPTRVKSETLAAGRILFQKAECLSCHNKWPSPPGSEPPSAPNLLLAKERLRPEWIFRWIMNPSRIRPGTKMPTFFEGAGAKANILNGKRLAEENGKWIYELDSEKESELAENRPASLWLGSSRIIVTVAGIDGKKIKIAAPRDLGQTISHATLESHGEPIDPALLGGDGYRQIAALRDYLMVTNIFPKLNPKPKN